MANIQIHDEVTVPYKPWNSALCFQRVTYHYDDGNASDGYRFIYRTAAGNLKPQRGQAMIPNAKLLFKLTDAAKAAGWLK